jgi:glycosyltransferase involved in cell wall biosynthesis
MRILFVSHMASRTGAPLLLLWLVQWLKAHTDHQLGVVLMGEGPLEEDFSRVCQTWTWHPEPLFKPLLQRVSESLIRRLDKDPEAFLEKSVQSFEPDVIYLNTLVLGRYLKTSGRRRESTPIYISHVHELEITLETMSNPQAVSKQLSLSSAIISCAQCVQDNLTRTYPIKQETKLHVVRGNIPFNNPEELISASGGGEEVEAYATIIRAAAAEGRFIFGTTGQAISRKGFDLLPLLVQACRQTFAKQKFLAVWIGAPPASELCQFIRRDLQLMGLEGDVLIIPPVRSALALIRELHAFNLLSREDPHPLVVLEAASLGIPTVCFGESGGIGEFVQEGCGLSVPYLDLHAMAEGLYTLAQDPLLREELGTRARQRVFQNHTLEQAARRILSIIETSVD